MGIPRAEMSGAAVGDVIVVPGGLMSDVGGAVAPTDVVEIYDPDADEWKQAARMPGARHHIAVAAHDGRLYVFGGIDDQDDNVADAWAYDPTQDSWRTLAAMPFPVAAAAAAAAGDHLYVAGGLPGGDTFLRYDPVADVWEILSPMLTPRDHLGAVTADGVIYVVGGNWAGRSLDIVEIYDLGLEVWRRGPFLLEPRAGFGIAGGPNGIIVAGGEVAGQGRPLDTMETLTSGSSEWAPLAPLPETLAGLTMAVVGDGFYALGGSRRSFTIANSGDAFVWR